MMFSMRRGLGVSRPDLRCRTKNGVFTSWMADHCVWQPIQAPWSWAPSLQLLCVWMLKRTRLLKTPFGFESCFVSFAPRRKTSQVCCDVRYHLLRVMRQRVCAYAGKQRQKAGWDLWERIWIVQIAHKGKTNFICQEKFIILYFKAHFYASTEPHVCTWLCIFACIAG